MKAATLIVPGKPMDKHYTITCTCGYKRLLGYMKVTGERLTELHESIGEEHKITTTVTDAPRIIQTKLKNTIRLKSGSNKHAKESY
jgi:hypothetical protein